VRDASAAALVASALGSRPEVWADLDELATYIRRNFRPDKLARLVQLLEQGAMEEMTAAREAKERHAEAIKSQEVAVLASTSQDRHLIPNLKEKAIRNGRKATPARRRRRRTSDIAC
jgi:hypothetical protein